MFFYLQLQRPPYGGSPEYNWRGWHLPFLCLLCVCVLFSLCFPLFIIWQRDCSSMRHEHGFSMDVIALCKLITIIIIIIVMVERRTRDRKSLVRYPAPGHSAKSADGRLQLNKHTLSTLSVCLFVSLSLSLSLSHTHTHTQTQLYTHCVWFTPFLSVSVYLSLSL